MLRIFAALPVPEEICDRVMPLMKGVPNARWRPRENLHITLAFYGDITHEQAGDLDEELARIEIAPFELRLEGANHFGKDQPHALWLKVSEAEGLIELARQCRKAAQRCGITMEKRNYLPHLTLAYIRGEADQRRIQRFEQRLALYRSEPFIADRFHLYSSHETGRGPNRYEIETEYPLVHPLKSMRA